MRASRGLVSAVALLCLLSAFPLQGDAAGVALHAPRFVLNRSFFLSWTRYSGSNFTRYEVHLSTAPNFVPSAETMIHQTGDVNRHYFDVRGLSPNTTYYTIIQAIAGNSVFASAAMSCRTLRDGNSTSIPIMMYHNVAPRSQFPPGWHDGSWASTEQFEEQMAHFRASGVNCITHREYFDWKFNGIPMPPNPVMLTFDDGCRNFKEHALPLLLKYDYVATSLIVTRKVGLTTDWTPPVAPIMTWDEIRECRREGMWIGSHSQTHADPNEMTDVAVAEVEGSYQDLLRELGEPPGVYCYPYGRGYQLSAMTGAIYRAGYAVALRAPADNTGLANATHHRYRLPRLWVYASDSLSTLVKRMELETDGDGLMNWQEVEFGTHPGSRDGDGDGLNDPYEVGFDGDQSAYNPYDPVRNLSGVDLDAMKTDTDGDGLSDYEEVKVEGTSPTNPDSDGDGLNDGAEISVHRTNPFKGDTDGDGLSDGEEVNTYGSNPRLRDTDDEGLSDYDELMVHGTDPAKADTDDDALSDYDEIHQQGTNPKRVDTDGDGLTDGQEVLTHGSNPKKPDSDGDGLSDGDEVLVYRSNPAKTDTDGDGLSDGDEVHVHKTDPKKADTDGDGYTDRQEALAPLVMHSVQFGFGGVAPVPGDYNGDRRADEAVYDPRTANWYIVRDGMLIRQWGFGGTIPVQADYDGDRLTDAAVYYPPSGEWFLLASREGYVRTQFGYPGVTPVPADYNGDGRVELAVYDPAGIWYIADPQQGMIRIDFGFAGAVPVPADYDGDGKADIGVYHPPTGNWSLFMSQLGARSLQYGFTGCVPVPADYDDDGKDDIAVCHPDTGMWYILMTSLGHRDIQWGYAGTRPVRADRDGDGRVDPGVYDPRNGMWYFMCRDYDAEF